jgi:cholesterol transport system auxiliary component
MMRHLRPLAVCLPAVLLIVLTTPTLSGCISLFPKADPVALYRFDGAQQAAAAQPGAAAPFALARIPTLFPRASAGDRILTVTGSQVAYIAGARWVSPASALFDEAVQRAFSGYPPVRLAAVGEPGRPDYLLRLEVLTFETRYLNGPSAAPVVSVEVRASLTNARDRTPAGTRIFTVTTGATENRVTAIVAAYDTCVQTILSDLRQWVAQVGRS